MTLLALLPAALVAPYEGGGDAWRRIADETVPLIIQRAVEAETTRMRGREERGH